MSAFRPASLVMAAGALVGCASDVVLPDQTTDAVCGNGIVESGEACDSTSPGCGSCEVVPGWTCPGNQCSPICGDGVVGTGASCADAHRDVACDMTGYWAARETDYERDTVLQNVQTASTWYLYRFAQSGSSFEVVEDIECGIHTTGSATVDDTPASLRALMHANPMSGGSHGARHGTATPSGAGCSVTLDRWYFARGVEPSYLPSDFSAGVAFASMPPLPAVADPVNGADHPPGAVDIDGDGFPGIAFQLTGLVPGIRDDAQRTWKQYASAPASPLPSAALQLVVPGTLDVQTSVLHVYDCGSACALAAAAATVASDIPARVTLAFVGRTPGSARVASVVAGPPGKSPEVDLSTCANVRRMLPHDRSPPPHSTSP